MYGTNKEISERFNWMREMQLLGTMFLGWGAGMQTSLAMWAPSPTHNVQAILSNAILIGAVVYSIRKRPKWQKEFEAGEDDAPTSEKAKA